VVQLLKEGAERKGKPIERYKGGSIIELGKETRYGYKTIKNMGELTWGK
jgi:hypothetical protein